METGHVRRTDDSETLRKERKGRKERKRGGEIEKKPRESDEASDVGPLKRSPETLFQKRAATFCRRFAISRL